MFNTVITREMQIEITVRCHYTLTRMAKIKNINKANAGEDEEKVKLAYVLGGHVKWYSHSRNLPDTFLKT